MKKTAIFLFAMFLIGCSAPKEEMEKDKTLLKSTGIRYEHLLLNWNEPVEIKYLNADKFVAVWERGALGSGYQVRVLFDKTKVMSWKIEEINIDKIFSKEISMSTK